MLGNPNTGLSVEELADLMDLAVNTVCAYLSDPEKRANLAGKIRLNPQARARALQIVSQRRGSPGKG
jgi:hypothetical protein